MGGTRNRPFSHGFLFDSVLSHSQKSDTVTSVTVVLTMQNHINVCHKYLKNGLGD